MFTDFVNECKLHKAQSRFTPGPLYAEEHVSTMETFEPAPKRVAAAA
jgi:hypothetical protein